MYFFKLEFNRPFYCVDLILNGIAAFTFGQILTQCLSGSLYCMS
jgi:hypothetical protein